ncbi:MAG: hypothetical protein WCX70_00460 [Candidatus Paceibacterota bacterium]|jgi:cation:H+ antiporter
MIENLLIFIFSLLLVIKGATMATTYSSRLAENFRLSKYVIGFIIVAFISILPETIISINSALKNVPEFGLGTLFGGNIADLTLVLAILIIYVGRNIHIESKVLKDVRVFPFFLLLPLLFGLNGYYSRLEGVLLILVGIFFYYLVLRDNINTSIPQKKIGGWLKNLILFLFAMFLLLTGSHFTVESASSLATALHVPPLLIGLLVVGLGTTMPEFFYCLKTLKKNEDGLVVGDILGTVLADATIVIGILAVINPFSFPKKIIYVTGFFMLVASFILINFMRSGKIISKKEGYQLFIFWLIYALAEVLISNFAP